MQTFMPYSEYHKVAKILDYRRLGKQRIECLQTYNQLTLGKGGFPHHPINKMWKYHVESLAEYTNAMITEWINRGYKNTMHYIRCCKNFSNYSTEHHIKPDWVFYWELQRSHQSNLLRKDWEYYRKCFDNDIQTDMPYSWPEYSPYTNTWDYRPNR